MRKARKARSRRRESPFAGATGRAKDPGAPASDGLPVGGIWNLALHQDSLREPVDAVPEGLGIAFQ